MADLLYNQSEFASYFTKEEMFTSGESLDCIKSRNALYKYSET